MSDINAFNAALKPAERLVCDALRARFDLALNTARSRLYHGSPVWFLDENPLVGYSLKKTGVAVLFWSGQSFQEPGLTAVGKHKAAEFIVREGDSLPQDKLDRWLAESKTVIWDYKNIARRNGVLERVTSGSGL